MNWLERLNDVKLEIITGDGQKFYPKWQEAKKNISYNVEGFDFVGVQGTYVERKEQSGNKFPILLYFEGEDCIEQATRFEYAARNPEPWTIHHPFYDALIVQPINLEIDNSVYNISKISGMVWETINWKYPLTELNVKVTITQISSSINSQAQEVFKNNIVSDTKIIQPTANSIDLIRKRYRLLTDWVPAITLLKDLARTAHSAAINMLQSPIFFMQQIQDLINFPFKIEQDIEFKINQLRNSYNDIKKIFFVENDINKNTLSVFEGYVSAFVSVLCDMTANYPSDGYKSRASVLSAINSIISLYNDIILVYDNNSYKPNPDLALLIDRIKSVAVGNLYAVANESRQERTVMLDKDDNIVVLAHKYYGPGDGNLENFITENELSLNETLQLEKGRRIIYYI